MTGRITSSKDNVIFARYLLSGLHSIPTFKSFGVDIIFEQSESAVSFNVP